MNFWPRNGHLAMNVNLLSSLRVINIQHYEIALLAMENIQRVFVTVSLKMIVVLIARVYVGKRNTSFNKNALTLIVGAF